MTANVEAKKLRSVKQANPQSREHTLYLTAEEHKMLWEQRKKLSLESQWREAESDT